MTTAEDEFTLFRNYADAGFGPELLPIIPRGATLSPSSTHLEPSRGKVPGKLGKEGWFGFVRWTEHRANEADLKKWERWRGMYGAGVGLQGRHYPAVDIDVDDDALARELRDLTLRFLGSAPVRTRGGERCLLVYACTGLGRRRLAFRLAEQDAAEKPMAVELLGDGQQYLVEGIHPSGEPYVWDGSASPAVVGSDALTRVSAEDVSLFFDKVRELVESRGHVVVNASQSGASDRQGVLQDGLRAPTFEAACQALEAIPNELEYDDWIRVMAAFKAATYGEEEAAARFAEWSSVSGKDDPDATRAKWDSLGPDFAIGWHQLAALAEERSGEAAFAAQREFSPVVDAELGPAPALPIFERRSSGEIVGSASNLRKALEAPEVLGLAIGFDEFKGDGVVCADGASWRPLKDEDYFGIRLRLESLGFRAINKELLRDAVWWVSHRNSFDSAQAWLEGLVWDGAPRIERFFVDCLGMDDTPYARACGRYVWSAHAGRVLDPGCIAAMVPVLIGPQGNGKSRAVAAVAPSKDFHDEFSLRDDNAEQARKMRGTLVGELPELTGLRTRALEEIKAWITQTHDTWRPLYKETNVRYARRLLLWGTSNEDEIFADPTGERRWLPLPIGRIDVDRIEAERDQLWAEGANVWRHEGVVFADAERLAKAEHSQFRVVDAWEERLSHWLHDQDEDGVSPYTSGALTTARALTSGLGFDQRSINKSATMRVAEVLKQLRLERTRKRVDGRPTQVWVPSKEKAPA